MITVSRGDVALVDYPYSDRAGSKVRPCVVVQNDAEQNPVHARMRHGISHYC